MYKRNIYKIKKHKQAFTLAEVLITLGIIGVVAAMTLPSLINNTKNQEFISKLKKVNSMLAQATLMIIAHEGEIEHWGITDGSDTEINRIADLYKKELMVVKDCGNDANGGSCVAKTRLKTIKGTGLSSGWANGTGLGGNVRTFVLNDGTSLVFDAYGADASGFGVTTNKMNSYILITADLNGEKNPNQLGRDTFLFVLTQDGIIPAGTDMTSSTTDCKPKGVGYHCAAKVLAEGKMSY